MEKSLESDALYRRYIELSKTASRLLLLLISIALYISFTVYKNWDAEEKYREFIRQEIVDEVRPPFGPVYQVLVDELYNERSKEKLSEKLDKIEYNLPIVGNPISLKEFFTVTPLIFFVISVFYWLYLRYSLGHFRAYCTVNCIHTRADRFRHPWLYELPIDSLKLKFLWQGGLELV